MSLAVLGILIAAPQTFAKCKGSHSLISRSPAELLPALEATFGERKITCIEDLGPVRDASQFLIVVDEQKGTARLIRTGGGWGSDKDYGTARVRIAHDTRGTFESKIVKSVDHSGAPTDELNLKVTGSSGFATVRLDSGGTSRYVKMRMKCE